MMITFPDISDRNNEPSFSISNISNSDLPVSDEAFISVLKAVETEEKVRFQVIELVFVDEEEIVSINQMHLSKDYVTDIITFRYDEDGEMGFQKIEATLYCCAPRIKEQSKEYNTEETTEFLRVFAHGLLHLAGYHDHTPENKAVMTQQENRILELIKL